jgi:hypothetical protein
MEKINYLSKMSKRHNRSKSSDSSYDESSNKNNTSRSSSHLNTNPNSEKSSVSMYTKSKHCDSTNYSDKSCRESDDNSCDNSFEKENYSSRNNCSYDCGLKYSNTPVGVWNMIYTADNVATTTGTIEWINQFLLNGDETVNSFGAPDVGNNPIPHSLSSGLGIWKNHERKIKMELTHIGYLSSDGSPKVYYRIYITMKLNNKRTKARFRGEACSFDISDPTMCTPSDIPPLCFQGNAVKVLEPGYTE